MSIFGQLQILLTIRARGLFKPAKNSARYKRMFCEWIFRRWHPNKIKHHLGHPGYKQTSIQNWTHLSIPPQASRIQTINTAESSALLDTIPGIQGTELTAENSAVKKMFFATWNNRKYDCTKLCSEKNVC